MPKESLPQKSIRILKTEGVGSLFKKAGGRIDHKLKPLKRVLVPRAKRAIETLDPEESNVDFLIKFASDNFAGLIRPAQVRYEITELANVVKKMHPKSVMEIGTANGGTLFLWSRLADAYATVISMDLPGGEFGGGYPEWKINLYKTFARPQQRLHLLREDSHSASAVEKVRRILDDNPLDFLFIDGDHTYEGVKKDFELYSPLVRKGGVIAFHDIAVHPVESGCLVDRFWNEIKKEDSREVIADRGQKWAGIGIYRV
ncbi:MAG TPA: class I SAM-dependent methyltransferase [Candidatus Paceibacterota bacterium]|nr:class I SAM-dependent methyltransferase [Candidatus Paceibacterota bacterium]